MREIYRFQINKTELIDETEVTKDEKGNDVKQIKKVEKSVPHSYFIKRPNRSLNEDAEIFRAATESEYIKKGIITIPILEKRIINEGDIYSDAQKKEYEKLKNDFVGKQTEYDDLIKVPEAEQTQEQKDNIKKKLNELSDILGELNKLQNLSANLYNRTAESLARNKTILYLTLVLSYEDKDGKFIPVFGEGDFEKKLAVYDAMEEREDKYEYELIQKLNFAVSLFYLGRATTKDEFDTMMKLFENQNLLGT